jgi:hypothetical protein
MVFWQWNGNVAKNQILCNLNLIERMPFFKAGRKAGQE